MILCNSKVISGTTKKGQALLRRAAHYEGTRLRDVYGRYSDAKEFAMLECLEWCSKDNGYNFRIISHNTSAFSVAWNYINKETGEIMTRIETSAHSYIVDGARPDNSRLLWEKQFK